MNTFRFISVSLVVFTLLFIFAIPKPEFRQELANADLPWNIKLYEDGSSEVFGLRLEHSNLQDAINRFHEPEDVAIYLGKQQNSLEAYFGTINIGPLEAKLVVTLATTPADIETMLKNAQGRDTSNSEDTKVKLAHQDKQAALKKQITGITFIPKYSGLESDFFKKRFGEPASSIQLDEESEQYFYPEKGLSITIDAKGKDILQYCAPAKFSMPQADTTEHTPQAGLIN